MRITEMLVGVSLLVSVAQAEIAIPRQALIPVAVLPGSTSARPYYHRISGPHRQPPPVIREPAPLAMPDRLPLLPRVMRPDRPTVLSQEGLYRPIFVIGMNAESLAWFAHIAQDLSRLGATGIVVQADDRDAWDNLRQQAANQGLALQLLPDTVIAEGYGVTTYPVVIASPDHIAAWER